MSALSGSERIMVQVEVTFPDGEVRSQGWNMELAPTIDVNELLPWVTGQRKAWDHPQDPITFKADVKPGCEEEVREWLLSH
jgi:hypothetical protein